MYIPLTCISYQRKRNLWSRSSGSVSHLLCAQEPLLTHYHLWGAFFSPHWSSWPRSMDLLCVTGARLTFPPPPFMFATQIAENSSLPLSHPSPPTRISKIGRPWESAFKNWPCVSEKAPETVFNPHYRHDFHEGHAQVRMNSLGHFSERLILLYGPDDEHGEKKANRSNHSINGLNNSNETSQQK